MHVDAGDVDLGHLCGALSRGPWICTRGLSARAVVRVDAPLELLF